MLSQGTFEQFRFLNKTNLIGLAPCSTRVLIKSILVFVFVDPYKSFKMKNMGFYTLKYYLDEVGLQFVN